MIVDRFRVLIMIAAAALSSAHSQGIDPRYLWRLGPNDVLDVYRSESKARFDASGPMATYVDTVLRGAYGFGGIPGSEGSPEPGGAFDLMEFMVGDTPEGSVEAAVLLRAANYTGGYSWGYLGIGVDWDWGSVEVGANLGGDPSTALYPVDSVEDDEHVMVACGVGLFGFSVQTMLGGSIYRILHNRAEIPAGKALGSLWKPLVGTFLIADYLYPDLWSVGGSIAGLSIGSAQVRAEGLCTVYGDGAPKLGGGHAALSAAYSFDRGELAPFVQCSISYTSDLLLDPRPGASVKAGFASKRDETLAGLSMRLSVALAYNDYEYLMRIPAVDNPVIWLEYGAKFLF